MDSPYLQDLIYTSAVGLHWVKVFHRFNWLVPNSSKWINLGSYTLISIFLYKCHNFVLGINWILTYIFMKFHNLWTEMLVNDTIFFVLVRKHVKKSLQIVGTTESQNIWGYNCNDGNSGYGVFLKWNNAVRTKNFSTYDLFEKSY